MTGTHLALDVAVAYHDQRPHPLPADRPYTAVCNVAPDGSRPAGFDAYDDEGGWPDRNLAYCELSVQRRLESRSTAPFVGLCHYRRVFLPRPRRLAPGPEPGTYAVTAWDWARTDAAGAGERDLLAALQDRDWLVPVPYDVRRAGLRDLLEQFTRNHPAVLLREARDALRDQHPHLPDLVEHLHRRTATPLWNLLLGRRELLVAYGRFLWPVLERCRERLEGSPDLEGYQSRWAGFLAERLHGYWLEHLAVPAGARVGTLPVAHLQPRGITRGGAPTDAPVPAARPDLARRLARTLPPALVLRGHQLRGAVRPRPLETTPR